MRRLLWLMEEPDLSNEVSQERDIQFHNAIAEVTGNPVIVELLKALRTVIAKQVKGREPPPSFKYERDFHKEMVDAIAARDPNVAQRHMEDYFEAVHESMGIEW